MKRFLIILLLALTGFSGIRAQEVYNMVLDNATRIVNSPTSNFSQTQIAQFKRTALIYMKSKAFELADSIPSDFLDTQAYYMSEFVTLFFNELIKTKKLSEDKRKERIMLFMDASVSCPMFKDPDEETTLSFITSGGELTPFSLDTDWIRAYNLVQSQLK